LRNFFLACGRQTRGRHFRVRFERFQWLAAPFPRRCLSLMRKPRSRVEPDKCGPARRLSEKQYQVPTGLARNCRFFLSSVPAFDHVFSSPLENAEQPNPVSLPVPERMASKRDRHAPSYSTNGGALSFARQQPSGVNPRLLSNLRISFIAAVLSRRRWTSRSIASPSSSTVRQSQNFLPPIITTISSRCD
jgi:hypothetical protein